MSKDDRGLDELLEQVERAVQVADPFLIPPAAQQQDGPFHLSFRLQ